MIKEYVDCRQALKEVYVILRNTNLNDVSKIPVSFLEFIEENKDDEYEPTINFYKPLAEQNLKPETINILSLIYMKYWCDTQVKKDEYKKILMDKDNLQEQHNTEKIEKEIKENNLGLDKDDNKPMDKNVSLVVAKKGNIFKRLLNWIKRHI